MTRYPNFSGSRIKTIRSSQKMKGMKSKSLNTLAATLAVLLPLLTSLSARAGTITVVNLPPTNTDIATGITTNLK
jgi:hypothetical protein